MRAALFFLPRSQSSMARRLLNEINEGDCRAEFDRGRRPLKKLNDERKGGCRIGSDINLTSTTSRPRSRGDFGCGHLVGLMVEKPEENAEARQSSQHFLNFSESFR